MLGKVGTGVFLAQEEAKAQRLADLVKVAQLVSSGAGF